MQPIIPPESPRPTNPAIERRNQLADEYMSGSKTWEQIIEGLGEDIGMMRAVSTEIKSRLEESGKK